MAAPAPAQTTRLDQQQASLSTLQEQMTRLLGEGGPGEAAAPASARK